MNSARRGRIVAGIGLAAAAALAVSIAALWPDLARGWHLLRLERDPSLFEEMFLAESRAKHEAAVELLRRPEGQEALCQLFILELDRCEPSLSTREQLLRIRRDPAQKGVISLWEDGVNCQTWTGTTGHSSYSTSNRPTDPRRRRLILDHLGACAGRTFTAKGIEGVELQVRAAGATRIDLPVWPTPSAAAQGEYPPGAPSVIPGARFACFFRVAKEPLKP